ncbi:hypothetical protein Scep_024690 [Stephania cephalantha]|uniref:Uncharacterized protein n=1 Tax=Stephania cephalantha TaxID=152367 RepID=A0AAP0EX18_9MAGN
MGGTDNKRNERGKREKERKREGEEREEIERVRDGGERERGKLGSGAEASSSRGGGS